MSSVSRGGAVESAPLQLSDRQFAGLLIATSFGSLFEWYDLYLAATAAAAVWPRIFFPTTMDPALALAVSVATVGIAYVARPIGAIIFGHIGDKYGRRNTLVGNLLLMGITTVGTALLPPYVAWGLLSIVLIFVFRFLIGVGLGGEGGSAFSWIAEARPNSKNRGFWITWPSAVLTLGKLLSILAFFIAASSLSNTAYLDWGWRVPFLVGGVMLAIGLVTRLKIMESPMFQQLQAKRSVLKQPAFQVMKDEGRKIFTLLWLHAYVAAIPALVILPYSVSYLVAMKMPEVFANLSVTVGTAAAFFTILGGAYLSDRIGRLKVLRIGGVITIAVLFPYFWLLNTLNVIWILVAQSLLYGVEDVPLGANTALYAESFATKYRASGAGLCFQLAGLVTGILVAVILPILIATYGVVGSWQPLVWISIVLCASSIGASFFVKETKGVVLE